MRKALLVVFFVFMFSTSVYADYMVQLKAGAEIPEGVEAEVISEELNIYTADEKNAFLLFNNGIAEYIEKEQELEPVDISYTDTYYNLQGYMQSLNIDKLKNTVGVTGDVKVAIIDTGVNTAHADFVGANFETGYNYVKNSYDTLDYDNHGTMVAGMMAAQENNGKGIVGIAPNATYVPYVVLSGEESSTTYLIKAIFDATDNKGCKLINISLGTDSNSNIMQQAIDYATDKGVIIVAAAANNGASATAYNYYYPASCENVISVGSVNSSLTLSSFSQKNDMLDVAAVGEKVCLPNKSGGYSYASGTSFSSPMVCGILALVASYYPNLTHDDAMEMLRAVTYDTGESGKDYMGYGVIDAMECYNYLNDLNSIFVSPVFELEDGSYNIKLESDTRQSASLVVARYVDGQLTSYDIRPIELTDNVYCENIAKKGSDTECIKIFVMLDVDTLRSLSLVKIIN